MLTEADKELLEETFAKEGIKELALQQTEKMASITKLPLKAVEWFALKKGLRPLRYEKNLGSIGISGQMRLLESRIILVGLGGLGGYLLEELARAGVGQIAGVDPDIFCETNLNRQLLAEEDNLGKKKIVEAESRLKKINKAVGFMGFAVRFDELPEKVWRECDLVFDCLDNIKDRLILASKCSAASTPLVHGAIAGWCGQVGLIMPDMQALEKIYRACDKGIEKHTGTPPFTAALTASLMAAEGIKVLTGKNAAREQKMLFLDLLQNEWETINF